MASTDLRAAAQQALQAMSSFESGTNGLYEGEFAQEIAALRAALEADDGTAGAQALAQAYERGWNAAKAEPDLSRCPQCGGPADNGHDRSIPPSPYFCTKCMAEHYCDTHCTWADHAPGCVMEERNFCPRCGKRANGIHTCTPPAPLTDEVIADLWHKNGGFHHHFARAIERWLRGHA